MQPARSSPSKASTRNDERGQGVKKPLERDLAGHCLRRLFAGQVFNRANTLVFVQAIQAR